MPAEPQREGDPEEGLRILLNDGYVGCGIPYSLYSAFFGPAPESERIAGREGHNAELAYSMNAFTTSSGVEVVSPNCLSCHASVVNGEIIAGLGDTTADYTKDYTSGLSQAGPFITDPEERAEFDKWAERASAIGPYIQPRTVGVNPADNLAAILFAHRDRETLAWSSEPLLEPPPTDPVPVDVPPWWRMKKKNAMFYSSSGRGDHARIMMTTSTLCIDSVEEAAEIDSYFHHVRAYIASLEPPAYPGPIDEAFAEEGRDLFESRCSRCHGSYGDDGEYPNRLIALDEIDTDRTLANRSGHFAERFVDWFNGSFYGETAQLEPHAGYLSPPLDGIWATAPFLHNGSVPSLELLLDSTRRPTFWKRDLAAPYDVERMALAFEEL